MKTKQSGAGSKVLHWILFLAVVISLWEVISLITDNSLVCPGPGLVFSQMMDQLSSPTFFITIGSTIARAVLALVLSVVFGCLAAFLAFFSKWARSFLDKIVSLLQCIPNIAYIIILLFWAGRWQTVQLSAFFMLFPSVYRSLHEQLQAIQKEWKMVWTVYPQPRWVLAWKICLPLLGPALLSSIRSASSVSFKVCVMAEIMAGLGTGIGRSMQAARMDLNLAGVLAWCIWLIIIVYIAEKLWIVLCQKLMKY